MSDAAGAEPELPDESDGPDNPDHPEESRGSPARPRLEVSGTQVAAGALASVSAAVVASFFGAAGTLTGAAVASVTTTVGSAVYGLWIRHTGNKLRQAQGVLPFRPTLPALRPLPKGRIERWRAWLSERRAGVLAGVGLVFVVTMAVVTLVEVVGQRPLSSIASRDSSGTTSIGAVVRGDGDGNDSDSGSDSDDDDDQSPDTTSTTTSPGADSSSTSSPSTTSPSGDVGSEEPSDAPDSSVSTTTPESPSTPATDPPASSDQSTPTSAG
jgi:hypothetical protein